MGAVQQRVVAPVEIAGGPVAQQIGEEPARLLQIVIERVRLHAVLRLAVGLELFLEQDRVPLDEPAGHLEDLPGAAVIPVENDRVGDVEVAAEALEDVGVGSGPGEDGLLVVAHREAVAVLRDQAGDDLVLRQAQVLELVHQDAVPSRAQLRARLGVAAEQLSGEPDEVVVVDEVARAERLAVRAKELEVARGEGNVLQAMPAEEVEAADRSAPGGPGAGAGAWSGTPRPPLRTRGAARPPPDTRAGSRGRARAACPG